MITIYTTGPQCSRCNLLKDAFQKANLEYQEKPLDATILARVLCETDIWVQEAPLVLNGAIWYFASELFTQPGNLRPNWQEILAGKRPRRAAFTGSASMEDKKQECSKIWGNVR